MLLVRILIIVSAFLSLCTANVHFDIEHIRWTAYLEVPENETITSPGKKILNPISDTTRNLVIEDYEEKMEFLPENIAEVFPELKNLWIFDCVMKSVTKQNLKSLKQLELLSIMESKNFTVLEENSFEDLIELRDLYLDSNSITKLYPSTFVKLEKLELLDLRANNLTSLDKDIFKNNINLEYLLISENQLMTIASKTFDTLKNLTKVWLNNNEITHLPKDVFAKTEKLKELYLDGNEIANVDNDLLVNLSKLRKVSFAGNMLQAFDFEIIRANEALVDISLSENQITTVLNVDIVENSTMLYEISLAFNKCVNQVFFAASGKILHHKMNLFKLQEKCPVLDLDSAKNVSSSAT